MIKRVYIKNFRSIKELEIKPTPLCAIIGPNSSGKSNILRAIDLVLGEGWATKGKVMRELFHDENEEIKIEVDLLETVPVAQRSGVVDVDRIVLKMSINPDVSCEVRLLSSADEYGREYYINEEFKKQCHFIYIPSNRDLSDQMRVSSWTLLGKLMKLIYENYIAYYGGEKDRLQADFASKMQDPKQFLENKFDESSITYAHFVEKFTYYCESNSRGFANAFKPELNIYNLNWFYKTLQILVKEDGSEKMFDSDEVGAGMQNLILISIFQTYADLMKGKVIMGIEEPELYLYPHAQRKLYANFKLLSQSTQILYTTHNPYFVEAYRAHEVIRVLRTQDAGTDQLKKSDLISYDAAEHQRHKIYTHFNLARNEIFFAKKVLLVEGDADKVLFSTLSDNLWNIDLDSSGISIIECGGKGGVIYFIGFCELMGFSDYFAIWDRDADEEFDDRYSLLRKAVESNKGLEIAPNLEGYLKDFDPSSVFNQNKKVESAYNWALNTQTTPAEFDMVRSFLIGEEQSVAIDDASVESVDANDVEHDDIPF